LAEQPRCDRDRFAPITVPMKSATLTWEQTLAVLLPLLHTRVWATTYVGDWPVSAFAEELRRVDVGPALATGVEEARLDFGDLAGLVFLRRNEHLRTLVLEDGTLRVELVAWALELEPQ
jgi:hypothetical protein